MRHRAFGRIYDNAAVVSIDKQHVARRNFLGDLGNPNHTRYSERSRQDCRVACLEALFSLYREYFALVYKRKIRRGKIRAYEY